jgi:hypothetical protein
MTTKYNEITKRVINIYDNMPHPNPKCQDIKEDWTKFCFYNENKKHKDFLYYKGSQKCNELFNDYYECFVKDKTERK